MTTGEQERLSELEQENERLRAEVVRLRGLAAEKARIVRAGVAMILTAVDDDILVDINAPFLR